MCVCVCFFSWVGAFAVCCGWLMVVRACWMVVRACSFMHVDVIISIVSGLCFFVVCLCLFAGACIIIGQASNTRCARALYQRARNGRGGACMLVGVYVDVCLFLVSCLMFSRLFRCLAVGL